MSAIRSLSRKISTRATRGRRRPTEAVLRARAAGDGPRQKADARKIARQQRARGEGILDLPPLTGRTAGWEDKPEFTLDV